MADAGAVRPDEIDKKTLEIRAVDDEVYSDVASVADELPDHAPRFVLLSYPLTLVCLSTVKLLGRRGTDAQVGLWSPIRTLCHAVLSADHLQQRSEDALCWR